LKAKGIAEVIVYCCTDGAVMMAWGKNQCIEGSMITFMADTRGYLTKKLGVTMKHPGPTGVLGAPRCQRHAIYVEDGVIKAFEVAATPDDPAGDAKPDCTLVDNMLSLVPDLADTEKGAAAAKVEEEKKTDIEAANTAAKSADLVLLVKPGCPFCKDAFETLQGSGFNPKVIEATRSMKRGLQQITGKTSVPSAWVKGTYIGGCNDGPAEGKGVKPMVASGDLKKMLG
jgi:glutaredoxin 3